MAHGADGRWRTPRRLASGPKSRRLTGCLARLPSRPGPAKGARPPPHEQRREARPKVGNAEPEPSFFPLDLNVGAAALVVTSI